MKTKILTIGLAFLLAISLISFVSAETSYCCEKTVEGAWCQSGSQESCDENYKMTPTSCESTSYCKLGTCYDSQEGTCSANTAQKTCEANGGTWDSRDIEEISQCSSGCCILGDEGKWATQTQCKFLSGLYGLTTDFRTSITSELECILTGSSKVKGACVFEDSETGFGDSCEMTSRGDCSGEFYEGLLCSAEELGTNCGPSQKTTCVEGDDKVYFLDTCGNRANIYDALKIEDKNYWREIYDEDESCGYGEGNINSRSCGNCEYLLGSTCKTYKSSEGDVKPVYGDNVCRDLSCVYEGERYEHGESWCVTSDKKGTESENYPGTEHFKFSCYNGEVISSDCSTGDYRNKICIQGEVNDFSNARCVANLWHDCIEQTTQKDCENAEARDCKWIDDIQGFSIIKNIEENRFAEDEDGNKIDASCVPKYPPAFDFWNSNSEASDRCSGGSFIVSVKFKKSLLDFGTYKNEDCDENCFVLNSNWQNSMADMCSSLGDCGSSVNYLGKDGWNLQEDLFNGLGF